MSLIGAHRREIVLATMYAPVPFNERSEGQKVVIGAVIPASIGGLAGAFRPSWS